MTFGGSQEALFLSSLAFSPDGRKIALGYWKGLHLYDVATGKNTATFIGHTSNVYSVVFSPDGSTIATGSNDLTVQLWDSTGGQHTTTHTGHIGNVSTVVFSPTEKDLHAVEVVGQCMSGMQRIKITRMST